MEQKKVLLNDWLYLQIFHNNFINFMDFMKMKILPLIILILVIFISISKVYAATTPDLGIATTFGILSSTFTRNSGLTTITGDLGYTTLSGSGTHTASGTTYISSPSQAGTDQTSALSALALESCTFTFTGVLHLASDTTHGPIGVYTPGVYCSTGAMDIEGGGTITLSGSGTYIFRSGDAFDTTASSIVALSGASSCDVFWTVVGATTLGANSTFKGTVIDNAGITVGSTVNWEGRALAFSGTVITDTDTITVPTCTSPTPTPSPTVAPTSTPVSTATSSSISSSVAGSSTVSCPALSSQVVPPNVIKSRRIDFDSIFIKWGPYSGTNMFNISYGTENGNWLYTIDITGFETTINNLPTNQSIWVRVAARNNCAIGNFGESKLVGVVTNLIPHLPNTGVRPFD